MNIKIIKGITVQTISNWWFSKNIELKFLAKKLLNMRIITVNKTENKNIIT